jgi:hypothetical protein
VGLAQHRSGRSEASAATSSREWRRSAAGPSNHSAPAHIAQQLTTPLTSKTSAYTAGGGGFTLSGQPLLLMLMVGVMRAVERKVKACHSTT